MTHTVEMQIPHSSHKNVTYSVQKLKKANGKLLDSERKCTKWGGCVDVSSMCQWK